MANTKPGRFLPREGFHADVLLPLLRRSLLNPALTLPAYLLGRFTERGRLFASDHPKLSSCTSVLAALSVLRVFNAWMTRRVLNNRVSDLYDWEKEIVVVTGGSDGIGGCIVKMLAERGIKVAVLDIQPLQYQRPESVRYFACDLATPSSIEDAVSRIRESLGHPTVLINNAGVCHGKPLLSTSDRDVRLTFSINTLSHYTLTRLLLPHMISRNHGMIVTIASAAAYLTTPRMVDYASSKAAALAFHEGVAAELATLYDAPKVRSVAVTQSYTRTKLFEGFGVGSDKFFAPALHVETVAEAVVEAVLAGQSGEVVLPRWLGVMGVAALRGLPGWMGHQARVDGVKFMQDFRGRQVLQGGG